MNGKSYSPVVSNLPDGPSNLKPLSEYSTMITCEQKARPHHQINFSNPFVNLNIEVINSCAIKRKLEDSSDDGCETPAKRVYPNGLSPDQGCFMDSVSPPDISLPALFQQTQAIKSEIKESVISQLHSGDVDSGYSIEPGVNKGTVPHSLEGDKVLLNLAPAFDCAVGDILSHSPLFKAESYENPNSNTCQVTPGPAVSGSVLESRYSQGELLEGDVEEETCIGPPIFESSICQASCEEEATLDSTYQTTLPLQVAVKSVVVVPPRHTSGGETPASSLPGQSEPPTARSQRRVFYREEELERQKRLYISSVTRHLTEHPGANEGVMGELFSLMNRVADETAASNNGRWQHPSDLTCRNYQKLFGNQVPRMTLLQWQNKNDRTHRRFAKIPNTFTRSPCE